MIHHLVGVAKPTETVTPPPLLRKWLGLFLFTAIISNFAASTSASKAFGNDATVRAASPSEVNRRLPFLTQSVVRDEEQSQNRSNRHRRRHLLRDGESTNKNSSSAWKSDFKEHLASLSSNRAIDSDVLAKNVESKENSDSKVVSAPTNMRGSSLRKEDGSDASDAVAVKAKARSNPFTNRKLQGGNGVIPINSILAISPEVLCWETAASLQFHGFQCTCMEQTTGTSAIPTGNMVLECHDFCGYCDLDGTVCGKDFFQQIFTSNSIGGGGGVVAGGASFQRSGPGPAGSKPKTISPTSRLYSFQYVHGQDQLVQLEYTGCNFDMNNDGIFQLENIDETQICNSCNVYVDGTKCNSCTLSVCGGDDSDDEPRIAPFIDCGNVDGVDANVIYSLCYDDIDTLVAPGHPLYVFSGGDSRNQDENEERVGNFDVCYSPGRLQCEVDKNKRLSGSEEESTICSCSDDVDAEGQAVLTCNPNCGEYCNGDDRQTCGTKSYSTYYSSYDGSIQFSKESFRYTNNHGNSVLELQVDDYGDTCEFTIDGSVQCDCMMQTCASDGITVAPFIDCSSVLLSEPDASNAIVDLCNNVEVNGGILEYLSANKFDECIDTSPINDRPICDLSYPEYILDVGSTEIVDISTTTTIQGSLGKSLEYPDAKSCTAKTASDVGSWYTLVGSGYGVTVSTCGSTTKFDTQISVYTGGCDGADLVCVAGNDDDFSCGIQSTVMFFAEIDQVYHIRVHGYETESGTFGLTIGPGNVLGPFCEETKLTKEKENDIASMACTCTPDGLTTNLVCVDECRYCNTSRDVCTKRSESWTIEAGSPTNTVPRKMVSYEYTSGANVGKTVEIETSDCNDDGEACAACSVTVNDVACTSCATAECADGTIGYAVDCSNVEGTTSAFNTCNAPTIDSGSLLHVFAGDGFDSCIRGAVDACTSLDIYDEDSCSCAETDSGVSLSCQDPGCVLCSTDYSVCATASTGAKIDNDGQKIADVKSFQYIEGRDEIVTMETAKDTCNLLINGQECTSCEYTNCYNPFADKEYPGIEIDCSNIEAGATIYSCNGPISNSGILQVFNDFGFDLCLDPDSNLELMCEDLAIAQEQKSSRHSDEESSIECTCEQTEGNFYTLTCFDTDCLHCNSAANICATKGDGATLNKYGQFDSYLETYQYVEGGRSDSVVIGSNLSSDCFLEVNGIRCNSCKEVTCTDEFGYEYDSFSANCDNVKQGLSYNGCDNVGLFDSSSNSIGPLDVVFDHKFDVCLDVNSDAAQSCVDKSAFYESWGTYSCECLGPDENGQYKVSCVDTSCLYCDSALEVCGRGLLSMNLNRFGNIYQDMLGFKYETGRTDEVFLGLSRGSNGCDVMVNGEECSKCEIAKCEDESGEPFWNHQIQCDNVPGGANLDLCSANDSIDGLFGYMSSNQYLECIKPTPEAADACIAADGLFERRNPGMSCECWNHINSSTLMCDSPTCKYCNEDESVCELEVYEAIYSATGSLVSTVKEYQYISGRKELITVTTSLTTGGCSVAIDGMECASCEEIECSDGTSDLKVDCSNLSLEDGGTAKYECGDGHDVFQSFMNPAFSKCVSSLPSPAQSPTAAPMKPSDPGKGPSKGSVASLTYPGFFETVISLAVSGLLIIAL